MSSPHARSRTWLATLVCMVLSLGLTGLTAPPAAAAEPSVEAVQQYLDAYRSRHGLPGVAVALVKDGTPVLEAGSSASDEPLTATTPTALASVSKVTTTFAVLQLVDDGALELDDPVVQHLPEFVLDDPRGASITVRQLLSHTSGLPNPTIVPPADSPQQRVTQLRDVELASDPETSYLYSNLGYQTAARLIEVVSGQSYPDYLDEHLFGPLGMDDTAASVEEQNGADLISGHVTAYGGAIAMREMAAMNAGSGDVVSTAHDMALWMAMVQREGVAADGTRVLSADLVEESQRLQPGSGHGGLGWEHTQTSVPERIGKSGTLTRYSARIDLVPSSGYAVVVLMNSYTTTFDHPFEISSGIIDLTEGKQPTLGAPTAAIIDAVLGVATLLVSVLTVRGTLRSGRWVERRQQQPVWRFVLRLLPQLIMPATAVAVFGVLPLLKSNSATPVDAFGLWPAGMILLLVLGLSGLLLTITRIVWRAGPQSP